MTEAFAHLQHQQFLEFLAKIIQDLFATCFKTCETDLLVHQSYRETVVRTKGTMELGQHRRLA